MTFTITAEDGSVKLYTVTVEKNAAVFFGSSDGYVYSVNGATGALHWKHSIGYAVTAVTVSGGVVYAGNSGGYMYALDGLTGAVKWNYRKLLGSFTIPTVHNNQLFAGFTRYDNNAHFMVSLDAGTGQLAWETQMTVVNYGLWLFNPTYANGLVYITNSALGLIAYDAATGAEKWRHSAGLSHSSPAVADGVVYVGSENDVIRALDAATGTLKWKYSNNNEGNMNSGATVAGNVVYIGANTYMYAIDKVNGTLKWRYQATGGLANSPHFFSTPVVAGATLYACNNNNITYAINTTTGTAIFSDYYSTQVRNPTPGPVIANGTLFSSQVDKKLIAYNSSSLKVKWTFETTGVVNTNPCVADLDGNVFHTGDSGDQQ